MDPKNNGEFTSEDFERLCRSIGDTVSQISKTVGQNLAEAGTAMGSAVERAVKDYQAKMASGETALNRGGTFVDMSKMQNRNSLMRSRFRGSGGLSASAVAMTASGGFLTFSLGMSLIIEIVMASFAGLGGPPLMAGIGVTAVCLGLSVWLLAAGMKRLRLVRNLKDFQRIIGDREFCSISELAIQTQQSEKKTLAAAYDLLKRGMLPQGHMDDEETCLIVTNDAYHHYRQAQRTLRAKQMEQRRKREEARLEAMKNPAAPLPEAVKAFINNGNEYIQKMKELDAHINDEAVSEKIRAIEGLVEKILERVSDEPSVIDGLDRLMNYYLPTTVKLLSAYDDLEGQPVQGENIASSRHEIEQTLDVLQGAYEKLLDATFQDLSMDVSTDISVLHAMLAQEGLTDGPFDAKR